MRKLILISVIYSILLLTVTSMNVYAGSMTKNGTYNSSGNWVDYKSTAPSLEKWDVGRWTPSNTPPEQGGHWVYEGSLEDSQVAAFNISPNNATLNTDYLWLYPLTVQYNDGTYSGSLARISDTPTGMQTVFPDPPHDGSQQILGYYWSTWHYQGQVFSSGGGGITFNPNATSWTNSGKLAESTGSYPVNVRYTGTNPLILQGTATIHSDIPVPPTSDEFGNVTTYPDIVTDRTETFLVTYNLQSMSVSGDAYAYISGASGSVNIMKQGQNLQLSGTGTWASPIYTLPTTGQYESLSGYVLPPAPDNPTGTSGLYNLDWTKSPIGINPRAASTWINNPVPYTVSVSSIDNLSGFNSSSNVQVTDYSHYGRNKSDSMPYGGLSYNNNLLLDDGMYHIGVTANDIAGNTNNDSSQTYLVDGTSPTVTFNIPNGIFSEANGAERKASIKGSNFAYYGKLTYSDNLSGCSRLQYSWTFGSNDTGTYEQIYSSPYTYTDRYQESFTNDIEKPVGDNLYLHVKLWDTAGNYTYSVFGPFEDQIKLKKFEVTDICDPSWSSIFWTDDTFTTPTRYSYPVSKLPVDNKSNPIYENAEIKKGYAFNFDITSEFMYRAADKIEIKPSFYYWDGATRTPVDLYYTLYDNPFTKVGSIDDTLVMNLMVNGKPRYYIGGLSQLTLNKDVRLPNGREYSDWKGQIQYMDGKEQYWYGEYFIPGNSIFVPKGKTPRPENVLENNWVIVNFDIVGYKYGAETLGTDQLFNYNPNQWKVEGGPKNDNYQNGDIIVYDNAHNVFMDYDTNVTH